MTWQFTWFLLPLGAATVTCTVLAVVLWRRESVPGSRPMAWLLLAIALWDLAYLGETARADLAGKLSFEGPIYLAVCAVPALWLVFALEYCGRLGRRRRLAWLLVEPALVQVALATNDAHRLFFDQVQVVDVQGLRVLVHDFGPVFWLHAVYSWGLIVVGTVILFRHLLQAPALQRRQVQAALAAVVVPLVGNLLFVFGYSPVPHFDLGALTFTVTAAILSFALYRLRFLHRPLRPREFVIEAMEPGVLVLDGHLRLAQMNPAARRILGLGKRDDVTGQALTSALPEVARRLPHLLREPQRMATTEIVLGTSEDMRVYELRASPLVDGEGMAGHLLVLHDITDAKHEEQVLRAVTDAARAGSQAKTEFLARMSHELRTPLNAIIGYAQLLGADGDLPSRHRRPMRVVEASGSHLLALIDNILDLSKIETGVDDFSPGDFDLRDLIDGLDAMFQLRSRQKGLDWRVEAPRTPWRVHGDEAKVRQILINLLGNAVKFTATGGVTLTVTAEGDAGVRFDVRDTGPGIAPELGERVFDPFLQAEAGLRQGGTGLGLAIARRQAQIMGGSLELQSDPGVGSVFTFRVPLPPARGEAASTDEGRGIGHLPAGCALRACVVDDVESNRDVLAWMLRRSGVEVRLHHDAAAALAAIEADVPDVVFTDLSMPGMDGYALRERLAPLQAAGRTRVVAVSASVMNEERQVCLERGFDAFLGKPLRVHDLQACLEEIVGTPLIYAADGGPGVDGEVDAGDDAPLRAGDIPEAAVRRLQAALRTQSVSDLRAQIEALPENGAGGVRVAERLRPLLLRFDMEGMRRLLAEVAS